MDIGRLDQSIELGEGCKLTAYKDTEGIWTIGWGTNLQSLRIDQELADKWKTEKIKSVIVSAKMFPEWQFLDTDARQNVFIEMVYNMGPMRVSGFTEMRKAITKQDWETAAKEGLSSKWATQVGQRANRLMEMLRTGQFQV
jgi:lysozyme